jgi:LysW-gamma-L-lysine carboxypeptidase
MKVVSMTTTREGDAERLDVGLNFRVPPAFPVVDLLAHLDKLMDADGQVAVTDRSEGVEVDSRNPVVRGLIGGIRAQGARPTLLRKLGTSDLNIAVPAWHCPAAAYGPGDAHLDHTDREHIEIRDLRQAVSVLRHAFSALTMGRPPSTSRSLPTSAGKASRVEPATKLA